MTEAREFLLYSQQEYQAGDIGKVLCGVGCKATTWACSAHHCLLLVEGADEVGFFQALCKKGRRSNNVILILNPMRWMTLKTLFDSFNLGTDQI